MVFTRIESLFILAPLALLALFLKRRRRKNFYSHPLISYMRGKIPEPSRLVHLPRFLELLALACLAVALLNPALPSAKHLVMHRGLDIVLVLDLSSSMQEPIDMEGALRRRRMGMTIKESTRLDAVKEAIARFAQKRQGDRIGLVVFSENGYVVAPMTPDTAYLINYLKTVDHKTLASEGQTAIGEGIFTALQLAEQQSRGRIKNKGRLMVVLTDGENNTGRDVYLAIQKAVEAGFKIYFIGVEIRKTPESLRLVSALNAVGASYYDVRDSEQVGKAYGEINRLEKGTFLTEQEVDHLPYYYPFALASVLLLAASVSLRAFPYFLEIT
jgi:Ca-activated chloride channel family protein